MLWPTSEFWMLFRTTHLKTLCNAQCVTHHHNKSFPRNDSKQRKNRMRYDVSDTVFWSTFHSHRFYFKFMFVLRKKNNNAFCHQISTEWIDTNLFPTKCFRPFVSRVKKKDFKNRIHFWFSFRVHFEVIGFGSYFFYLNDGYQIESYIFTTRCVSSK